MITPSVARSVIEEQWSWFADALRRGGDALWDRPTRCAPWTVADLAAHACWGTSLEADALARARLGVRDPASGRSPAPGASRADVLAALDDGRRWLVAELDDLVAHPHRRDLPLPYGVVPIPLALAIFVMEAGVHRSDLAAAMGEDDTLVPAAAEGAVAALRAFGPMFAEAAGAHLPPGAVIRLRSAVGELRFGVRPDGRWTADAPGPVTTDISGDDSAVWLFALGRRALDGLAVEGDAALARSFKQLVPGP